MAKDLELTKKDVRVHRVEPLTRQSRLFGADFVLLSAGVDEELVGLFPVGLEFGDGQVDLADEGASFFTEEAQNSFVQDEVAFLEILEIEDGIRLFSDLQITLHL